MENLKVDKVVFCCDIDGKSHQNSVDFCFCCCDITSNDCLFSNGPVRECYIDAPDDGENLTQKVQPNPTAPIYQYSSIV